MELRHLRYFLVVAEELHFGRAAERLHISQPPLSRQIQELERNLGVELLVREGRRVSLTPAGTWLKAEADSLLSRSSWMERHLRSVGSSSGHFSIGYTGSILFEFLPEILARFREIYPGWSVAIREMGSEAQLKAIHQGELDLGFVRDRAHARGLEYREIGLEVFAIIVPPDWELPRDSPEGLLGLGGKPFIGLPRNAAPALADRIMDLCSASGFYPDVVLECSQLFSVLHLVSRGLGWSLVPAFSTRSLMLPLGVTEVSFEEGMHELGIIYRSDDRRGMAERVVEIFRELSPEGLGGGLPAAEARTGA
jgi:DNA-binding transcriptional LysR family regulator